MKEDSMIQDMTSGSVARLLLRFAFPLFVSNALQAVYNIVDMIVVGQFIGGAGMSAVSIGGDLLHLLNFLATGFASAGQVLIAQRVGAGRMDQVRKLIGTMFTFLLGISLLMSVGCYCIRGWLLDVLNTPAESYAFTMDYTVTCIVGLVFIYGYNIISAILRGMGDSKRPFLFIAIAAVTNIVLDVLFVAYCGMEVFGAAFATVISQGLSFVISLVYLYHHRESFGFDFKFRSFALDGSALRELMALGIPMAIQSAAINISKIFLTSWINLSGVVYSALSGIYNKINMMIGIIANSFTTAGSTMVGQNLGAKRYRRVTEVLVTVSVCSMAITLVVTAVLLVASEPIFALFTADEAVLASASILIAPTVLNFFGSATRSISFSLINGSGNTKLNFAIALIDGMISRIGIAALLGFALGMGCQGFWYGDALAGFMPMAVGTVFYLSGAWRKEKQEG